MSEREEGFRSGVEAAAQVCTDIADKHHKKYHEAAAGQPTHIAFGEWSGAQDCYLALAALTPPPDGAKHWLGELLAVLHRDGGHYTATHGIEKSAKDALEEITRLKVAADGAEALLRETLDKLQNPIERPDFACNLIKRISAHLSGKD